VEVHSFMARDYYSVLVRATADLDPNTDEIRRALYDRARVAIMDAGLAPPEMRSERAALEAAIERIEADIRQANARSTAARRGDDDAPATSGAEGMRIANTKRSTRTGSVRVIALAAVAALIVAAVGYAAWPRRDVPGGDANRADASVARTQTKQTTDGSADPSLSYIFRRQVVYYRTIHPVGTIVIAKSQRHLYVVRPNVAAVRYTIGVGRECTNAVGLLLISAKEGRPAKGPVAASATPPSGRPPAEGADGSHDSRALTLGDTGLRISGTDPPITNGNTGCFALANEDMIDLYDRIALGARVVIS
jgi:lipoprotein-anchoring transpeptidase ErfK/SrfK